jgi:DHA1 family bicyclomycin/chloramphenicol resistance-like MFS transporter
VPARGSSRSSYLRTIVVLGMLSTFGPISLDLYLPALPQLAEELRATPSAAQLSITTCLLGLAVGQLIAGPLSDRFGRRRPLVIGLTLYLVTSAACAVAPSVAVLLVLRLLQGLSGAAGLVVSRAIARDLYSGRALVVLFSRLMLVAGLAPVIAPVLGGQLSRVMSWRGIFLVLAGFGVVLLVAGSVGLRETLPPERRVAGGLATTLRGFRTLLHDSHFVSVVATSGLASASMFAYIAGATFVLQQVYDMSPQGFSFSFGANSLGLMAMSQLGGRLVHSWTPARVLGLGLGLNLTGAVLLATTVLLALPLPVLLVSLFVMVSPIGLVFPTATALAMADYPHQAGTASSMLGLGQYVAGALVAPLVGIAGEDSAVPLGLVALACASSATAVYLLVVRPVTRRRHRTEPSAVAESRRPEPGSPA